LLEESLYRVRVGFVMPFPEQDFDAVGEEHIGNIQLPGVVFGLLCGISGVEGITLGFNDRQRTSIPVTQYIVSFGAVAHHHFIANRIGVGSVPTLGSKHRINDYTGKGFVRIHLTPIIRWSL